MTSRRLTAAILAAWVMVPVLAAGRPACCVKSPTPARPACCAAMTGSMPKGCCKPPVAPKPEVRVNAPAAPALLPVAPQLSLTAACRHVPTDVEAIRIARSDHRAPSPADSPPDLLRLHRALLI